MLIKIIISEENKLQDHASTVPEELNNEVVENVIQEKEDNTDLLEADSSKMSMH